MHDGHCGGSRPRAGRLHAGARARARVDRPAHPLTSASTAALMAGEYGPSRLMCTSAGRATWRPTQSRP
jgi:hypothetical protein